MNNRSERGQILVIGAAAMVILLGILALVIDLGFTWMLRRAEQNAVDPATIAAARYIPAGDVSAMEEAACFYARENGFFPDATTYDLGLNGCVAANDPNGAILTVNWPPASGPYAGDSGYVEVVLNSGHATFFSRVFGWGWMEVTTNAVAANASGSSGTGQLVALDPTSCRAGQIRGNGVVDVEGSIYVNSDGSGPPSCIGAFDDACSGGNGAFSFSGGPPRLVTPQLSIRGTCGQASNPYPANCLPSICGLTEGAPQIDDPLNLPTPTIAWAGVPAPATSSSGPVSLTNCDGPTDTGCSFGGGPGSWYELNPGVYYGGWTIQREVRLNPGFYYIAGGGIQVTGNGGILTIGPSGLPDGDGRILIYGTDGPNCDPTVFDRLCQGTISIGGQGGFKARAYQEDPSDPFDDDYQRILIWQAEGTSRTWPTDAYLGDDGCSATGAFGNDLVRIAGGGNLEFWGTIYAPKSCVQLVGNGGGLGDIAGVQVFAWRFDIGGNGDLDMPFDPDELSPILNKGLVQ
jgi:hypothetical protein